MENPIKMDDLGVPLFSETPIYFAFFGFPPKYIKISFMEIWSMKLKLTSTDAPRKHFTLLV